MTNFTHLRCHSDYSLLNGVASIDKLINQAKKYKMSSLALTDNGNMFGAIDFYTKAKDAGIKPIIGCEMNVVSNLESEERPLKLILLAKDYSGYQNLIRLVSEANTTGLQDKPKINMGSLERYCLNLIAVFPAEQPKEKIHKIYEIYKHNFYVGISQPNEVINGFNYVAINNIYYLEKKDARLRDIVYCVQTKKIINLEIGVETTKDYFYDQETALVIFKDLPEALENTIKIADQCNLEIPMGGSLLPRFKCPDGMAPDKYLEYLVWEGLGKRYPVVTEEAESRVNYELEVINTMGFSEYFLIVWDFVKYAKNNDIPTGPGRGSACSSIVAYSLRITEIDPLRYDLLFERFLNKDRISMPDIDLDFCINKRSLIIDYLNNKYGSDYVSQIATFGKMQSKAVVRDVGRVLNVPLRDVSKLTESITQDHLSDAVKENKDIQFMNQYIPSIKRLLAICNKLEGNIRHTSVHAAGVVLSKDPLIECVPIMKNADSINTQYSMTDLEKIGLLKIDILGLRNLTVLQKAKELIKKQQNIDIDLNNLDLNDKATFDLLSKGDTIGIFQLESEGMRKLLKKLKPTQFEDIIALLALYRPGPLGSKMDKLFVKNKKNNTAEYDLPELEPVLRDTYGVILYQEQVMKIANVVAGFTLSQADILRKAMGKKKKEDMDKMKNLFMKGVKTLGKDEEVGKKIFEKINKFAGYGFVKSHAAAYAMISYQTAYLKANYYLEYINALLSSTIDNLEKTAFYIGNCKKNESFFLQPDINISLHDFSIEDKSIRFGLGAIKNIGEGPLNEIINERNNGKYESLFDFAVRVDLTQMTKRTIECLIKAGAFDSIGERELLLSSYEKIIERARELQEAKRNGDISVNEGSALQELDLDIEKLKAEIKPLSHLEKMNMEKEMTGLYLTGHPLDNYKKDIDSMRHNLGMLTQEYDGIIAPFLGVLSDCVKKKTKTGKDMCMGTLSDIYGNIRVLLFPSAYNKGSEDLFYTDNIIEVNGRLKITDKDKVIFVNKITKLET